MKSTFKKQMFVQAKSIDSTKNNSNNSTGSKCNNTTSSFIDPATYMKDGEFFFRVPQDAPVFEPTAEDFLDPLGYINKIRPLAEQAGICKVKPPPEWHPPFAVDVDNFKFTPRVQKLNELDANTRVKLNFLDKLAMYWNYSGVQIRIPAIDDKTLDLYSLYMIVELEGGFEKICNEKRWGRVAQRMGYTAEKNMAPQLRQHYKRWLLPYERFEKTKIMPTSQQISSAEEQYSGETNTKTESKYSTSSKNASPRNRENRRFTRSSCDPNTSTEIIYSETFKNPEIADKNKELQRLTFYGPGPKILGKPKNTSSPVKKEPRSEDDTTISPGKNISQVDKLAESACMICRDGNKEENILLCDGCDDGYHTFCLTPPLNSIPKGEWRCPKCIAAVVSKHSDAAFGFEQAEQEYTLQQFGEMADNFKQDYFKMPVHMVPTQKVEQEYWKILSSLDSNVSVEYGADLHTMDHGSGFPTRLALNNGGDEYYQTYVDSSWNLNNIPVLEGSVLGYINADISGMKVPWMYVGMCFSTFCWHNEDHWSYSINYLHWGEPKTWYGVPGYKAEKFEQVMQEATPDLFRNQPDLLHQLVTILNPNVLMDRGVPIYHIDQAAGEFVITFPRSYHAGFNHGYNFAEAVNFAPVDWIPLGRECVENYSSVHRYCVFSHDELICKMASVPESLNSKLAAATHEDMVKMLAMENKQRKELLQWGTVNAEREAFELLADDERKCAECNTTCFLSAVTCSCSPKKVTCLRHFRQLCACSPEKHTLRYRYTLDELPMMLKKLKNKTDSVAVWFAKVQDALNVNTPRTITLTGLRELHQEAVDKQFVDTTSIELLEKAIKSVTDALSVNFKSILSHKKTLAKKITMKELHLYLEELHRIPCVLPQEHTVKQFLKFSCELEAEVENIASRNDVTLAEIDELLKKSQFPNVDLRCLDKLTNIYNALKVLQEIRERRNRIPKVQLTAVEIDAFINKCTAINDFRTQNMSNELIALKENISRREKKVTPSLNETLTDSKSQAKKTNKSLNENESSSSKSVVSIEKMNLDNVSEWLDKARIVIERLKNPNHDTALPFIEYIARLILDAQCINSELISRELEELKMVSNRVKKWREEARSLFLGDIKEYSLIEVLVPRRSFNHENNVDADNGGAVVKLEHEKLHLFEIGNISTKLHGDVEKILNSLVIAGKRELELMRALRIKNTYKKINVANNTHCLCKTDVISTVTMKECSMCKGMFHDACLRKCNSFSARISSPTSSPAKSIKKKIFLCPYCQRTKRPCLRKVTRLLEKLHELHVTSVEAIALKSLLDRHKIWKNSVVQVLNSPDLKVLYNGQSKITTQSSSSPRLSDEKKNLLTDLLFRGFLLELDMPENEIIYNILGVVGGLTNSEDSGGNSNSGFRRLSGGGDSSSVSSHSQNSSILSSNNENATIKRRLSDSVSLQNNEFDSSFIKAELSRESRLLESELNSSILISRPSEGNISKNGISTKRRSFNAELEEGGGSRKSKRIAASDETTCSVSTISLIESSDDDDSYDDDSTSSDEEMTSTLLRQSDVKIVTNKRVSRNSNSNNNNNNGKIRKKKNAKVKIANDNGGTDDELECDATKCLKPAGEHLDWVQCDYCKSWLHMFCIGVTKGEVDSQTEFMCCLCRNDDLDKVKEDENEDDDDNVMLIEYASPPSSNTAVC